MIQASILKENYILSIIFQSQIISPLISFSNRLRTDARNHQIYQFRNYCWTDRPTEEVHLYGKSADFFDTACENNGTITCVSSSALHNRIHDASSVSACFYHQLSSIENKVEMITFWSLVDAHFLVGA